MCSGQQCIIQHQDIQDQTRTQGYKKQAFDRRGASANRFGRLKARSSGFLTRYCSLNALGFRDEVEFFNMTILEVGGGMGRGKRPSGQGPHAHVIIGPGDQPMSAGFRPLWFSVERKSLRLRTLTLGFRAVALKVAGSAWVGDNSAHFSLSLPATCLPNALPIGFRAHEPEHLLCVKPRKGQAHTRACYIIL